MRGAKDQPWIWKTAITSNIASLTNLINQREAVGGVYSPNLNLAMKQTTKVTYLAMFIEQLDFNFNYH